MRAFLSFRPVGLGQALGRRFNVEPVDELVRQALAYRLGHFCFE